MRFFVISIWASVHWNCVGPTNSSRIKRPRGVRARRTWSITLSSSRKWWKLCAETMRSYESGGRSRTLTSPTKNRPGAPMLALFRPPRSSPRSRPCPRLRASRPRCRVASRAFPNRSRVRDCDSPAPRGDAAPIRTRTVPPGGSARRSGLRSRGGRARHSSPWRLPPPGGRPTCGLRRSADRDSAGLRPNPALDASPAMIRPRCGPRRYSPGAGAAR